MSASPLNRIAAASADVHAVGVARRAQIHPERTAEIRRRTDPLGTCHLVARRRAQSDERFVEVSLTAAGDAMRAQATQIHCDMKDLLG